MKFRFSHVSSACLRVSFLAAISGTAVRAATFEVSTLANSGVGSLRQAVLNANAAANPPHLVTFSTAVGSPFLAAGRSVIPISGILQITSSITFLGSVNGVVLSGAGASQLFDIAAGTTVKFQGLTFANGLISAGGATGGAVINRGNLTFDGCTLSGNNAVGGGATGGAIRQLSGNLVLLNSTVTGNSCTANGNGGAIFVAGGSVAVTHCTFQGNTPDAVSIASGSVSVANSIFTNNNGSSLEGTVTYSGANCVVGAAGTVLGSGTISTADPLLQPLANQGGPTDVHELFAASPAINSGVTSVATTAGLVNDQRGGNFSRTVGSSVDIGAVESAGNFLALTLSTTSLAENGPAALATLTRSGSTTADLTVRLTSSDITAATVPATVVIPAGQTSVTFAVTPVDDTLLDAVQTSLISANAIGFPATSAALRAVTVNVSNDDQGLTLTIPDAAMPENTGLVRATITRFGPSFTSPLTVTLSTSSARLALPPSVVLPANVSSFALPVLAVDNSLVDGTASVVITASAVANIPGSDTLAVTDDDVTAQTWVVDSATDENDGNLTAGRLSLREAIAAANLLTGKGRITFSTAVGSPFAAATPATIALTLGEFLITSNVSIEGPVQGVILDGENLSRVLNVDDSNPTAPPQGVLLSKIFLTRGLASGGGCVRNREALRLVDCSITNSATSDFSDYGCGLENGGSSRLDRCTVSGNAPASFQAQGGGIYNSGSLTLTNSTLAGNSGGQSIQGGGLRNTGLAVLTQVTVTGNSVNFSSSSGSGISNSGSLSLANSIVSNNTGGTGELTGNFAGYGVNLVRNLQAGIIPTGPGSLLTADPLFIGLGNHGGLTQTVRLALTSPAIHAGDDSIVAASGLTSDQRGVDFLRVVGSRVDLGAYEENFEKLTLSFASSAAYEGGTVVATVTRDGGNFTQPAVITLTSLNTAEATVPASVIIPAGQAAVTFTLTTLDDGLRDGSQSVVIQASGVTQGTWSNSLTVLDAAKFLTLSVSSETILENGGLLTGVSIGTVIRAPFTVGAVTVSLSSSDVTAATVPPNVVIPDGADRANFPITAVDDALLEDTQAVTLTATSAGFFSGNSEVNVVSDEADSIVVDLVSDASDGNTTPGNVSLREAVALAGANPARPSTITFSSAAGSPFTGPGRATILLLNTLDLSSSLTIRASASGVILDRSNAGRLMTTTGGGNFIRLENLTLKNGYTLAGGATAGGILNTANLILTGCTLTGNSANGGGARGGAIYQFSGTLGIYNSTVSGNSCTSNGNGGGIYLGGGVTRVIHSTLTANSPDGISGGSSLTLINSILHDNTGSSIEGNYTQEGVNIITGGAGNPSGSGTRISADPQLAALANNGGPSDTLLPGSSSPALNIGLNSAATGFAYDQRGLPRLSGSAVDLGSVEIQVGTLTYGSWATTQFPPGTSAGNQAFTADFDRDGLSNGLEFYLGSDPNLATPSPLTFTRDNTAGVMRVSYPHLIGTSLTSVEPQLSTDLILWGSGDITFGPVTAIDATHERLEARFPIANSTKQFFRLKLTQ